MLFGENNWRLVVRREADGVVLLRAATCDECAVLPDAVDGVPVVALGDHALTPAAAPTDGEALTITGAPCDGAWDNRALRELTLPPALAAVGDYALMNCRALQTLRLTDRPVAWGTGALMNCRALRRIELLWDERDDGGAAVYFAGELSGELDVSAWRERRCVLRLIFPEYDETYEENGPAHHFDYRVYGAGQPYHRAFPGGGLSLADYDALWDRFLAGEHEPDTALRIAWWRVCCPYQLRENAAARYRAYLAAHADEALRYLLTLGDAALTETLLREIDCPADALRRAAALARERRDTAATAILLEALRRKGGARRRYDL